MKKLPADNMGEFGFQIAPMIDVVFVIMLFFMVMAGAVKVENHLVSNLPAVGETGGTDFVDETVINVSEDGEVLLNDEPMDTASTKDLKSLKNNMQRLRQNSEAAQNKLIVTIVAEPQAKYGRVIDVMNALNAAKVTDVTFTVSDLD
jgi:biopolymer transport protein ExbD